MIGELLASLPDPRLQPVALAALAMGLALLAAWADRRTASRLHGMRRSRHGLIPGLARTLAALSRSPRPAPWPTTLAALCLLPSLLLAALLLASMVGAGNDGLPIPMPAASAWQLACFFAAACATGWILATPETHAESASRRFPAGHLPAWSGLLAALTLVVLSRVMAPQIAHPVAVVALIPAAALWSVLARPGEIPQTARLGAAAHVLARAAAHLIHLSILLLLLAALPLASLPAQVSPDGPALAAWIVLGAVLVRIVGESLLASPTPRRLARLAWGGLIPLAALDLAIGFAVAWGGWERGGWPL